MSKLKEIVFGSGFRIDVIELWSDSAPPCFELPDRLMVSRFTYEKIMSGEVVLGDLPISFVVHPQIQSVNPQELPDITYTNVPDVNSDEKREGVTVTVRFNKGHPFVESVRDILNKHPSPTPPERG